MIDAVQALAVVAALLLGGTLPGAGLVWAMLRRPHPLVLLVVGTIVGLGLWALGAMLSGAAGIWWLRFVPSGLALVAWAVPILRRDRCSGIRTAAWPLLGAGLGVVLLLPAAVRGARAMPDAWSGWYQVYADVNFHIALTAEVLQRTPQVFPWASTQEIAYTWGFHAAMGVWGGLSGATAATIVVVAWPLLAAVLLPAAIALVGWQATGSRLVALLAPAAYALAQGFAFLPEGLHQVPLYARSPTRDFGHLALLLVSMIVLHLIRRRAARVSAVWPWSLALAFAVFVAVGAKGSTLALVLGGGGVAALVLLIQRRAHPADLLHVVAVAIGAGAGLLMTLNRSESFSTVSLGAFSFLPDLLDRPLELAMVVATLIAGVLALWWWVAGSTGWPIPSFFAGVLIAGLAGLMLVSQTGLSQRYFWTGAAPVLAIMTVWALDRAVRRWGWWRPILAVVGVFGVGWVSSQLADGWIPAAATWGAAVLAAGLLAWRPLPGRPRTLFGAVALVAVLAGSLIWAGRDVGVSLGASQVWASDEDTPGAIHGSQLAAFDWIRAHTDPDAAFISNAHCYAGSVAAGDCLPRVFAIAAWAERRVLVEGWGYANLPDDDPGSLELAALSDGFIRAPSDAGRTALAGYGIDYVYVDRRYDPDPVLSAYAELVYESEAAQVWELTTP